MQHIRTTLPSFVFNNVCSNLGIWSMMCHGKIFAEIVPWCLCSANVPEILSLNVFFSLTLTKTYFWSYLMSYLKVRCNFCSTIYTYCCSFMALSVPCHVSPPVKKYNISFIEAIVCCSSNIPCKSLLCEIFLFLSVADFCFFLTMMKYNTL